MRERNFWSSYCKFDTQYIVRCFMSLSEQ
jgi:hypothetical protein